MREILDSIQYRPDKTTDNYEVWRLNPKANRRQIRKTQYSTVPFGSVVFYRDKGGAIREFFNKENE